MIPRSLSRWNQLIAAALLFFAGTAQALTIHGRVIHVSDGDSISVLVAGNKQQRIRIHGIDAPERGQPFADRSQQSLSRMVHGKDVTAVCHKQDRFKRQICKVWVQPSDCTTCDKTLEVGYAQISTGLAWWYRQYANEQSAEDRGRYESEEQEAMLRRRGLWADKAPMPPWEWRQIKRSR